MDKPLSLDDIRALLEMLQKHEGTELKWERGEEKLLLRRGPDAEQWRAQQTMPAGPQQAASAAVSSQVVQPAAASGTAAASAAQAEQPGRSLADTSAKPAVSDARKILDVSSPMVGTFYRRPAVDADPYVEVGDFVKKGEVLCIVEAMKLMNEIESDYAGKMVEICLEDGQMVEYGEVLFRIEVS